MCERVLFQWLKPRTKSQEEWYAVSPEIFFLPVEILTGTAGIVGLIFLFVERGERHRKSCLAARVPRPIAWKPCVIPGGKISQNDLGNMGTGSPLGRRTNLGPTCTQPAMCIGP